MAYVPNKTWPDDACMSVSVHVQDYVDNNSPIGGIDHAFAIRKFA